MPKEIVSLSSLAPGESGTIQQMQGLGRNARQRLLEMGLMQGVRIRLVRRAPLGDPLEIHLKGYRLMLRDSEACSIFLERECIV
ncbi:MAG: ferrous iron transport protein A [Ignavibacteriae bacterium]|nr:ferrous iron transport protein A [Ignavibacteriota bacterium]